MKGVNGIDETEAGPRVEAGWGELMKVVKG